MEEDARRVLGDITKRTATTVTRTANITRVFTLSRRLIAVERARALGRKPIDLDAWRLEQEGKHWAEMVSN